MSLLNQLSPTVSKSAKRRGRGLGSGRGSKSGRGTTRHQTARTNIPLHFEGGQGRIVKKYPLLRGKSQNKSIAPTHYILTLSQIDKIEAEVITIPVLIEKNLVPSDAMDVGVKVLFDTDSTRSLTVQLPVSGAVKTSIEKAGGSILS